MQTTTFEKILGCQIEVLPESKNGLPLLIKPVEATQATSDSLKNLLHTHQDWVKQKIAEHGAILLRGFHTYTPLDFEQIALTIDPKLQSRYYGTSPRNINTTYTFSASELPPHYPIMQHCEMSFLKSAPRRVFFFCETAPQVGGETPLTDFRQVYRQLDPEIRAEFEQRGILNIRNYYGPQSKTNWSISQKRWDDMFKTKDKAEVIRQCQEQALSLIWQENDRLTLLNDQEAIKTHPETGEKVWFNHAQVFHNAAPAIEYQHIAQRQNRWQRHFLATFLKGMTRFNRTLKNTYDHEMHVTFADGTEIPRDYIAHLLEVIWENMVFFSWQRGDILAIDNFSTAHGRMPFQGPRNIMVAWTD